MAFRRASGRLQECSLGLCFCIDPPKLGAYPNFGGCQHGSRLSVNRREGDATTTGEEAHSRTDDDGKPKPVQMAGNFLFMVLDRGLTLIVFEHLRNCFAHSRRHFRNATVSAIKRRDLYFLARSTRGVLSINLRGDIPCGSFLPGTTGEGVTGNRSAPMFGTVWKKSLQLWTRRTVRRGRAATPQRGSREWGSVR